MQWITPDTLVLAGALTGLVIVLIQFIKFCVLSRRRAVARDYNKFVYMTYTRHDHPTPTIILRIQDGYVESYNDFLKRSRFLSLFFKHMNCFGEGRYPKIVDLFLVNP